MPDPLAVVANPSPAPDTSADVLLAPAFRDGELPTTAAAVERSLDGYLTDARSRGEWSGEANEVLIVPTFGRLPAARVAFVGLGNRSEFSPNVLRLATASAARALGKRGLRRAAVNASELPPTADLAATALVEGAELARYVPDPYRTGDRKDIHLHELLVSGASEAALRAGCARGRGKNLARELANEPANYLSPVDLANRAEAMAGTAGLECEILDEEGMARLGMTSILTVSRGSEIPARYIILRHRGRRRDQPDLALVGKGVCFDTGGISIKPAAEMGRMKGDMAGGAAVIGAMQAIAALAPAVDVLGIVPAVFNMPDGRAWLPGDVVTTMKGRTVETLSTDAEGRMLLADALHHACVLGARRIVDIATLTGACGVALGGAAAGMWGTDDELIAQVRECGADAGERHWHMPLLPEYREQIRSDIADLKNSGGRPGGANTAAAFLREFVGDTPWVHLDIAAASFIDKARAYAPAGPTGTGVGTFINLALRLATE